MRQSIAIDMDQVLANMFKKMGQTINELFGTTYTEEEFLVAPRNQLTKDQQKQLFMALNEPSYFRDLELLDPHAIDVVRELNEHFDIYIATAAMEVPGCFNAKYDWLREHFPFLNTQNFVFCGNKAVIHTDFLIDDNPKQLRAFKGTGLLYDMPYNAHVEEFERVKGWQGVREYFLKAGVGVLK